MRQSQQGLPQTQLGQQNRKLAGPTSVTVIVNLCQQQHMYAHFVALNRQYRRLVSTMWTRCTCVPYRLWCLFVGRNFLQIFSISAISIPWCFYCSWCKVNWCLNSPTFWESGSIDKKRGKYLEQVKVEYDNIIVIKLSKKDLFGTNTPVVLLWYKYTYCSAWSLVNSIQFFFFKSSHKGQFCYGHGGLIK